MGSYVWPCPDYAGVSSPFGYRTHPTTGAYSMHSGVDLACASGKPILATRPGTVTSAGWNGGYGNLVVLDHGDGISSKYAHCSVIKTTSGASVSAGDQIALVGSTGDSTGPHLHFEILENGTAKNPLNYVSDSDTADKYSGSGTTSSTSDTTSSSKEITNIVVKSVTGSTGARKLTDLLSSDAVLSEGCEILIQNGESTLQLPVVEGEATIQWERKGSPGILTFNVIKDGQSSFLEGNPVSFRVDGTRIFYGYIFKKKRNKNGIITVTCYDQLRYFKNKDTMIYESKKYSDLLNTIADGYGLKTGIIEDTGYVVPGRIEEGTLFDIVGNASDETVLNTGRLYVLYDDCGTLCLKNIEDMIVPLLIDRDTAEDYDYTSSIDDQTYNRIKLARDNGDTGERELYIAQDEGSQSEWGILQYYEKSSTSTSSSAGTATTGKKATSDSGISLIKECEGCKLYAYQDTGGTWTIGYGHTTGVTAGMTITEAQAESYLKSDLQNFESAVNGYVEVSLTQNMFDALVSLSFNIGAGAFKSSTLLQKLNQGDYEGAANQFDVWIVGGAGLPARRAKEKKLFLTGYSAQNIATSNANTALDEATLKAKAQVLLEYYNKKSRILQIKGCFGDIRVRGGSVIIVDLDIGDMIVQNYMVVESVKHKFSNCSHTMDIKVVGIRGEFIV